MRRHRREIPCREVKESLWPDSLKLKQLDRPGAGCEPKRDVANRALGQFADPAQREMVACQQQQCTGNEADCDRQRLVPARLAEPERKDRNQSCLEQAACDG